MAELVDTYIEDELEKIISEILKIHDDFNFYEIQEICQDFLDDIPTKIKSVTKIKRLRKFVTCEFELDKNQS
jgi:signal transduction histidine kinase